MSFVTEGETSAAVQLSFIFELLNIIRKILEIVIKRR